MDKSYIETNKKAWNDRVETHVQSTFYNMDDFLKGKSSLNKIELDLLGDLTGKKVLHLQCHFGQDSISLARMGATVTGVDLSDKAIQKANELALETQANAQFICCDIYDLPHHLDEQFDLVFTSYGTIGWLPDLDKWAKLVEKFLKPGGKFVFVEFHPVMWMYDNDFNEVFYSYFKAEPIVETEEGTYADKHADLTLTSVTWNHALSEVMTSLLKQKMTLNDFQEYDYSPYNISSHMIESNHENKFIVEKFGNKIPLVYSLVFSK